MCNHHSSPVSIVGPGAFCFLTQGRCLSLNRGEQEQILLKVVSTMADIKITNPAPPQPTVSAAQAELEQAEMARRRRRRRR